MITEILNPLGLKFTEPTRVEEIILQEIIDTYRPDEWGLNSNNVMLEIGAHSGTVSMVCAKKYGCKVFAYEPSPLTYRLLTENIRINQLEHLVFPYPFAITSNGRSIRMQQSLINSGASNIYGNENHPLVDSVSLKDAMDKIRNAGEFIQVMLMDCEGTEFELLKDVELLRGIPVFRGEFHQQYGDGNVDGLLERVKTVIPNSDPFLQKHVGIQM